METKGPTAHRLVNDARRLYASLAESGFDSASFTALGTSVYLREPFEKLDAAVLRCLLRIVKQYGAPEPDLPPPTATEAKPTE